MTDFCVVYVHGQRKVDVRVQEQRWHRDHAREDQLRQKQVHDRLDYKNLALNSSGRCERDEYARMQVGSLRRGHKNKSTVFR